MNTQHLTIGKAAAEAGVSVETIRFYERRGLIKQPPKGGGYRVYPAEVVARIRFVRQAQRIGFSLRETEELLALRTDPHANCADVRDEARRKVAEVDEKIAELLRVRAALQTVIETCPGRGELQACTILEALDATPREPCAGAREQKSKKEKMR
ncbi:MerR family DNA-binding protein [Methylobacterium brachiatum]|uniref:MerR family DNA-binding protein n=1 Tax=Methylobacterium brachiatum TaxID=269660 RepID=UPI000EFA5832|nr:MerR family DNA-binding protein [Methylobacterium brachiatum]AYO86637.1 MerR family transcriptional regulator [Methylobacterium brachiatum]